MSGLRRFLMERSAGRKGRRSDAERRRAHHGLYFKVSPEEMALIGKKMEQAGTKNKRAYLRKMAVDGYIVHLDMGSVKELTKLLRSLAANTNQIARRCNETRSLYAEDVEDLRKGYAAAQAGLLELLRKFASL